MVIHFEYSSVYMTFPNFLTIPPPSPLGNHKFVKPGFKTVLFGVSRECGAPFSCEVVLAVKNPPANAGEKAMATHSNTLGWRIPWMGEPGGLQSMGSHRVGYD